MDVVSPIASPPPAATMQRTLRDVLLLGAVGVLALLIAASTWPWSPSPTTQPESAARVVTPPLRAVTVNPPPARPVEATSAPSMLVSSPAPLDKPKPAGGSPGMAKTFAPPDPPRRLTQATVHRILASRIKACSDKWLTLKLHVVSGVGRVETINGFAPQPDLPAIERCVIDIIASASFPSTSPATFTLRFAPRR